MAQRKLGRQLLDTFNDITSLIQVTHDSDRLKELEMQSSKLLKQIAQLVDAKLDSSSDEYKAATSSFAEASVSIKKAIKGIDSVASAISTLSKAWDMIAKLAVL